MTSDILPLKVSDALYNDKALSSVLPNQYEMDGIIFAVAACPEIPMPEQWMPWVIRNSANRLVNQQVDVLADCLMNSMRAHLQWMRHDKVALPQDCYYVEGQLSLPQGLVNWLNGLLAGHKQLEPVWKSAWERSAKLERKNEKALSGNETPEARLSRCLKLFSTLANLELALSQRSDSNAATLQQNIPLLWKQLPALLKDYVLLAGDLAQALPNQFESFSEAKPN